jgi:iron complex transport system permease protein
LSDLRIWLALAAMGLAALFAALLLGSTAMAPSEALGALFGGADAGARTIIWEIRLPRALAAFIVGAALGLSGAALQGLLRNPLADPGVLGVSAAASLAATVTLYYGLAAAFALAVPIAAVAGALAATAFLGVAAVRTPSIVTLILIGVGVSSFAGALMALLMNLAPNPFSLSDMVNWMLGTVANRSFEDIVLAAPFLAAGAVVLLTSARGLSALSLGEEAAAGVGLDLSRARLAIVTGAGLATGAAVSLAGAIGFVGLVAPHLVRPLVGHDPARTLVPSALLAGLILVVADILVRVLPTDSELKLGVVAALIGAPAFVWIAARRRTGDG